MVNYLEKELVAKCKAGNKNAFRILANDYRQKLFGYCVRMTGDSFAAEDLFQEILIKVWTGIKKYKEQQKFSNWLFTIAHNIIQDSFRKKQKYLNNISLNENINLQSDETPHISFVRNEELDLIEKAVMSLPNNQKEVFVLRQQSNMTFKEISVITNEPINTVLSHMNYAMKKVKKIIESEYNENK